VRTARAATMPGRSAVEGRREDSANLHTGRVQCRCNYTRVEAGARRYACLSLRYAASGSILKALSRIAREIIVPRRVIARYYAY